MSVRRTSLHVVTERTGADADPCKAAARDKSRAGEEIGWRGYALPRLAARFGFRRASLLLGLLWGVWQLPLFVIPGHANYGQSFWLFVFGSTALSVAMAWLFMNTRGSVGWRC